ncbi:hypothetical protein KTO58_03495 [Chitinophaga pendula]|uniref:hypothetical protein n=1 Tax=Chitinophaga TaxID=79328 RepID=UPI0012FDE84D|nr:MULTISPECIES: hypothetical protein [Chitinophaga]UCJ08261.1 hypothetical protein KTO58_03495 [Chitinophaga pendula]
MSFSKTLLAIPACLLTIACKQDTAAISSVTEDRTAQKQAATNARTSLGYC